MNRFKLQTFATPDDLARAAAGAWLDEIQQASREGKTHSVALSGGRITQKLFASVVEQAARVSMESVEFFWADERCVPPLDAESNFRMAHELLFSPLHISERRIHRIRGENSPEDAARAAEAEIRGIVPVDPAGQPVLDLIFLGLGEDGHVASLFPGEAESATADPAVYRAVHNSPKPPPNRVTLGYPAIGAARKVWMLASGGGKEGALRESLSLEGRTPFARVLKVRSGTTIFTDIAGLQRP